VHAHRCVATALLKITFEPLLSCCAILEPPWHQRPARVDDLVGGWRTLAPRSGYATDAGISRTDLHLVSPIPRVCIRLGPELRRHLVVDPQRLSLGNILLVVGRLGYAVSLSVHPPLVTQTADDWSSHVGFRRLAAYPTFGLVPRSQSLALLHRKPSNGTTHRSTSSDPPIPLNGALASTCILLAGSLHPIGKLCELWVP